ncbi:MAG TPA: DUF2249 domain-containing protein [Acholeplasma sp.]|nr:DUF2249 domain-containing protein [Acholeplasma sp.]
MKTIDARLYEPKDKHKKIFDMFFSLNVGESMLLVNDHDPKPLYYQFAAEHTNQFEWTYQTQGPDIFEVLIKKIV